MLQLINISCILIVNQIKEQDKPFAFQVLQVQCSHYLVLEQL